MNHFEQLRKQPAFVYGDVDYLLEHKLPDGGGFPPSYVDFALQVGWGRLCGLFLVYIPVGEHPDSWPVQSAKVRKYMDDFYVDMEDGLFLLEPDGYPGIENTLLPFAMSENGQYLAWDMAKRESTGELPIYVIAARMGGIRYGAKNLYKFVENCTHEPNVKTTLGPGYDKLPATFEPAELVW